MARRPGETPSEISCAHNFPAHTQLFEGLEIEGELLRSRLERKPARAVKFAVTTAKAG
jgi:hypothetical protein